jgi:hypothetical protein
MRIDNRAQQRGIGKDKHLDPKRFSGLMDGIKNRLSGVVGKND